MPNCFPDICSCNCFDQISDFDTICAAELKLPFTLNDIVRQHVGWFTECSTGDHMLDSWPLGYGLYFLWHKEGYCTEHHMYHMTCKYVGKGHVRSRLIRHWTEKKFDHELVYFTYVELGNRLAKYVEQLLLDIYKFPHNKFENPGTKQLCAYFTQVEVD